MTERSDEFARLYGDWVEKHARDSELMAQYYAMGQGGQPLQLTGRRTASRNLPVLLGVRFFVLSFGLISPEDTLK